MITRINCFPSHNLNDSKVYDFSKISKTDFEEFFELLQDEFNLIPSENSDAFLNELERIGGIDNYKHFNTENNSLMFNRMYKVEQICEHITELSCNDIERMKNEIDYIPSIMLANMVAAKDYNTKKTIQTIDLEKFIEAVTDYFDVIQYSKFSTTLLVDTPIEVEDNFVVKRTNTIKIIGEDKDGKKLEAMDIISNIFSYYILNELVKSVSTLGEGRYTTASNFVSYYVPQKVVDRLHEKQEEKKLREKLIREEENGV